MQDLSTDTSNAALSMTTKAMEYLFRLIDKLFESWGDRNRRALDKLNYQNAKGKAEGEAMAAKMDGIYGYVSNRKLEMLRKGGVQLQAMGIDGIKKKDLVKFSECCRKEGVLYTALSDAKGRKNDDTVFNVLKFKAADSEKMLAAVKRFQNEQVIEKINKEMDNLKAKETRTPEEEARMEGLASQKENIRKEYTAEHNAQSRERIVEGAKDPEKAVEPHITLEEALNRNTRNVMDSGKEFYLADSADPDKYIKCVCSETKDKDGNIYLKTEYTIYRDNKPIYATNDERPCDWRARRQEIVEKADFKGDCYKFNINTDRTNWGTEMYKENYTELKNMEGRPKDWNLATARYDLQNQLKANGAEYKNGMVIGGDSSKITAAESYLIGEQIRNIDSIQELRSERVMAQANMLQANPNSQDYNIAAAQLKDVDRRLNSAYAKAENLVERRRNINSAQTQERTEIVDREMIPDKQQDKSAKMPMAEWKEKINERKAADQINKDTQAKQAEKSKAAAKSTPPKAR